MKSLLLAIILPAALIAATHAPADDLASGFRNPPHSAGIRCFWWWLNSNVTKEAITRDLEEMKAKGFNGAMIFDADGSNQQGNTRTKSGPVFGSQPTARSIGKLPPDFGRSFASAIPRRAHMFQPKARAGAGA